MQLIAEPISTNICFNIKGVDPVSLCDFLHVQGLAVVGYSEVKGLKFVRMSIVNPEIEEKDLDNFFNIVLEAAKHLENQLI